ncbi:Galactoside O-acetyltransferase [Peribacillus sp. Bi96]|uniref:acyltransferase n=1 Tax=Peribacillus sp. Bi96 TaxID=2884273 RepID=UPI001DF2EBA6|nr:DapH/DapD/GlmU-related protein [Peribacillus sp. Bi96]CAH0136811.1 Galactoside O-acetyltransferase [Peribacillus sp. Bi96]
MKKLVFYAFLAILNNFLKGSRFFRIKNFLLRIIGIEVGKGTKIVGPLYINYVSNIKIGNECWIGKNFTIDGNGSVIIGDRCDLAPHITINTGGHHIGDSHRRAGSGLRCNTKIESGTWIGTRVTIVNGADIGESVVVAAGSVVINDIKKNSLVAGVPAKIKKVLS